MKILVTGNMGYVGPCVVEQLKDSYPGAEVIGFDLGLFAHCLTGPDRFPETKLDRQIFGDVRTPDPKILDGIDVVIQLAAVSNDPMGNRFEISTKEINTGSTITLAKLAKRAGVKNFVFASSCSMYGEASDGPRTEESHLNPLTAYAKSKVASEDFLKEVADDNFVVTSLRFATACGMSPRLRLDLVLNDFVACAVTTKKITILSDGTPWRPLIHVKDMARAIDWAATRAADNGGCFLAVNSGRDDWNYQVKDLAQAVLEIVPGVSLSINKDAQPDKRSYRVSFDKFRRLAPNHQPLFDLERTIKDLFDGLKVMNFSDENFRESQLMRLKVLCSHIDAGRINENLVWQ